MITMVAVDLGGGGAICPSTYWSKKRPLLTPTPQLLRQGKTNPYPSQAPPTSFQGFGSSLRSCVIESYMTMTLNSFASMSKIDEKLSFGSLEGMHFFFLLLNL